MANGQKRTDDIEVHSIFAYTSGSDGTSMASLFVALDERNNIVLDTPTGVYELHRDEARELAMAFVSVVARQDAL